MSITFEDVIAKYSNNYLRRLAIESHLVELHAKLLGQLASDKNPFENKNFLKELADLYILLDIHRKHSQDFRRLITRRKFKFIRKLREEKEEC